MKISSRFLSITLFCSLASCGDPEEMDTDDTGEVDLRWTPPWQPPIGQQSCGNWGIDPGEECDDGNAKNDDICTDECKWAECGDGYVFVGVEQCDDGNFVDNDACNNECELNRAWLITKNPCGNGQLDPDEECDDGNAINTDTCTRKCKLAACGDSFVQGGEECDDGNNIDNDGCTNQCKKS